MPSYELTYRSDVDRRKAWVAHFLSIGCHPVKAGHLATDRCFRNGKWPKAAA